MTYHRSQPWHAGSAHFEWSKAITTGLLFAILVLCAAIASSYDDPVQDAYLSTVIGTGTAEEGTLPKQVPTRMR